MNNKSWRECVSYKALPSVLTATAQNIRLARIGDLRAIGECEDLAMASSGQHSRDVSLKGELASELAEIHLIADAARVLGFISAAPATDYLFVRTIAVQPAFQRRGIGSSLLIFVEANARSKGLAFVGLFTDGATDDVLSFYRGRGYLEYARCELDHSSRVYFRKALAKSS